MKKANKALGSVALIFFSSFVQAEIFVKAQVEDEPANLQVSKQKGENEKINVIFENGYSLTIETYTEEADQVYQFKTVDQPMVEVRNDIGKNGTYIFIDVNATEYKVTAGVDSVELMSSN
ncbi:hypothetical protein [Cellvibrio japonicus]|nr:hypothetical protein [Cellvibrio japonicus]QEI10996.1 hypothetical protein FY117_01295 [Cellvibrio japonicus]QEI14571.1 hypothetical protein FY116_01295 [Cellvibrio japonicus]QEI18150.1 hypothetical protein FY115_01295 [Cellvibrio japonicus]